MYAKQYKGIHSSSFFSNGVIQDVAFDCSLLFWCRHGLKRLRGRAEGESPVDVARRLGKQARETVERTSLGWNFWAKVPQLKTSGNGHDCYKLQAYRSISNNMFL